VSMETSTRKKQMQVKSSLCSETVLDDFINILNVRDYVVKCSLRHTNDWEEINERGFEVASRLLETVSCNSMILDHSEIGTVEWTY